MTRRKRSTSFSTTNAASARPKSCLKPSPDASRTARFCCRRAPLRRQRCVIRVALQPRAVEGFGDGRIKRRVQGEAPRKVGIGDKELSKGNRVRLADLQ